jgi:hypothetical protein
MEVKRLYYYLCKHIIPPQTNHMWKKAIRENKLQGSIASEYLYLLKSTRNYAVIIIQKLLEEYNIGIARDSKKEIERTARRVGLQVPEPRSE